MAELEGMRTHLQRHNVSLAPPPDAVQAHTDDGVDVESQATRAGPTDAAARDRARASLTAGWVAVLNEARAAHARGGDKKPFLGPLIPLAKRIVTTVPVPPARSVVESAAAGAALEEARGLLHGSVLRFLAVAAIDSQLAVEVVAPLSEGRRGNSRQGGRDLGSTVVAMLSAPDVPPYVASEGILLFMNLFNSVDEQSAVKACFQRLEAPTSPGSGSGAGAGASPGTEGASGAGAGAGAGAGSAVAGRGTPPLHEAVARAMSRHTDVARAWEFGMTLLGNVCISFEAPVVKDLLCRPATDGGLHIRTVMEVRASLASNVGVQYGFCHFIKSVGQVALNKPLSSVLEFRAQFCQPHVLEAAVDVLIALHRVPHVALPASAAVFMVVGVCLTNPDSNGDSGIVVLPALHEKLKAMLALGTGVHDVARQAVTGLVREWEANDRARKAAESKRRAAAKPKGPFVEPRVIPAQHVWEGFLWEAAADALHDDAGRDVRFGTLSAIKLVVLGLALPAYDVVTDVLQITNLFGAGYGGLGAAAVAVLCFQLVWMGLWVWRCWQPKNWVAWQQHITELVMPIFNVTAMLSVPFVGIL